MINVQYVFRACKINIVYDENFNAPALAFYDIITELPVIIPSLLMMEISKCIDSHTKSTGTFPTAICLFGNFSYDTNMVQLHNLLSVQILDARILTCYLERSHDNNIQMIDTKTKLKVIVESADMAKLLEINHLLNEAYNDEDYDFSEKGRFRLACIGNMNVVDNTIRFIDNESFCINTPDYLTYQLFLNMMNISAGQLLNDEDDYFEEDDDY